MKQKNPYVSAISKEAVLRADYLDGEAIETIYFGGGTPSQLTIEDLQSVLNTLRNTFEISSQAEITLEANPDDLNASYINRLLSSGFNRLSMGVQSFDDAQLKFLNRRHSTQRAIDAVKLAQQGGFQNISIDLMYGLPDLTMDIWRDTLDKAINLNIQHISSYHLIYETGTKLYRLLQKGDVRSADEELSLDMFSLLIEKLKEAGFIHYETSNFAKGGLFSRHNSSYWLDKKYLGLGPAAHSYNRINRCWNVASIPKFIEGIKTEKPNIQEEILDTQARYNDFILTGMRTMWGINISTLKDKFGDKMLEYCENNLKKHLESGNVILTDNHYIITAQGIFISDSIMSDLMYVD
ncbi:oxygen-independent coproporphyrinogen-3 oxidase [Dysgonomonas alginatilytica]|uniref:Heme chaperone HemW n=2 Tax=Dysgonomonas alginatilytica TaxID=1605892 RepID=A0A2V3PST9_9BACT|nr:oxygen-independent coproporphyrinogen-3 oxidase [Dysgonomonas alginatilytica]